MEDYLKSLEHKLNIILENQEKIIQMLNESIVIPTSSSVSRYSTNKKEDNKEVVSTIRRKLEEDFALKPHKLRLQKQFNLLVLPHTNRVKAYLKTKDPSVFDGLKTID